MRDPRPVLAAYYAAYFACIGIIMPFLPLWIRDRGFSPAVIGVLLALMPLAKIVAPWTWGRLADRTGRRKELLIASTLVSAVALAFLSMQAGLAPIFMLLALYAFTTAPGLPFTEATAMEQSDRRSFAYGPIRVWGSIAFMVVSIGFGAMVDRVGGGVGLLAGAGFLVLAVVAAVMMPRPETEDDPGLPGRAASGGRRAGVVRLFAACALMQASHGAYYAFFSIHLMELGYGGAAIGALWAFAVLCEVLLLFRIDGIVSRLGTGRVQQICTAAAALRWVIIAATGSVVPLVFAQALHALTYAAFHVSSLREVHLRFEAGSRTTGQTMYSGLTFGLGIFVGTLLAGRLADTIGFPGLFSLSAGIALASFLMLKTVPPMPAGE
jgi:PPP family 3-phenylpropionic acid transporter